MIEILYFEGCPNHRSTVDLTRQLVSELGLDLEIREVPIETDAQAQQMRFLGSPSVRVNGRDIEPTAEEPREFSLSCRVYRDGGVPPRDLLLGALRTAAS